MFADRGFVSTRVVLSIVAGLALMFALFVAAGAVDVGAQSPTATATTTTAPRTATTTASPPATGTGLSEDGGTSSTIPLAVAGIAALAGGAALFGASRVARR